MKKYTPAEFGAAVALFVKQAAGAIPVLGKTPRPAYGLSPLPKINLNQPAHTQLRQTKNFPVGSTNLAAEIRLRDTLRQTSDVLQSSRWNRFIHGGGWSVADQELLRSAGSLVPARDSLGTAMLDAAARANADGKHATPNIAGIRLLRNRLGPHGVGNLDVSYAPGNSHAVHRPGLQPKVQYGPEYQGMFMASPAVLNHELEHIRSAPYAQPGAYGNDLATGVYEAQRETPTGLGDLVFNGEVANQTWPGHDASGKPYFQHTVNYPSGKSQDIQWMIEQAKRHGYFKGKPMVDLIGSRIGQQYLRQAIDSRQYPQPVADQPPLPSP